MAGSGLPSSVAYSKTELHMELGLSASSVEKAMAPDFSTLAWKIPWMEEPSRLQSVGSV